jgi:hypothetical protein
MDRKSNEEVLKEINEKRTILRVVEMRKVKFIGHLLRHNDFVTNIMEGRVLGKKNRGRPRLSYIKNLMKELFLQLLRRNEETGTRQTSMVAATRLSL